MTGQETKAGLLQAIQQEQAQWEELLLEVGQSRMLEPGVAGDWSFKDVIAHLTGWRQRAIARLEAAQRGTSPAPPPWPASLKTDDDINTWIHAESLDRPLPEVLQASRDSYQQLIEGVRNHSEQDLMEPGRFSWMAGEPLGPAVVSASREHFKDEHEPGIRAWLATAAPAATA